MKHSVDRILTTHTGGLQGPKELMDRLVALERGESGELDPFFDSVRGALPALVRKQVEVGVDVINDGELGKLSGLAHYGPRWTGLESRKLRPGETRGMSQTTGERIEFREFYASGQSRYGVDLAERKQGDVQRVACVGPLAFRGEAVVTRDIELFKSALDGVTPEETFMCVYSPGWVEHWLANDYYSTQEEFLYAVADALKPEYEAVVRAGFLLQVDDPALPDTFDMIVPQPTLEEYRKFAALRVEVLNHALRDIPEDRLRLHVCWGSWHGPHTHDLPLRDIVDLVLSVNVGAYSTEAANPRHAHEWKVWRDVKLPEGKMLIPGVISHATNVVEHPELVADRLIQYAEIVGRENVMGGTDCGLGIGHVHEQISWAKLRALAEGAALASKYLWHE